MPRQASLAVTAVGKLSPGSARKFSQEDFLIGDTSRLISSNRVEGWSRKGVAHRSASPQTAPGLCGLTFDYILHRPATHRR
ncbi:hypothetical protein EXIGLDRAFT_736254 [Exidia glandulosa HHB12029]|uniref:Uncharacterized protein n=1 Tax=Exidia glandulosa HHB12029 TaxID=1314781 RepID=A0A165JH13_EXIGL|nr:hypothetical protein EXIGLDRAFT_736254 [Exidia glandulosa HHB12029]